LRISPLPPAPPRLPSRACLRRFSLFGPHHREEPGAGLRSTLRAKGGGLRVLAGSSPQIESRFYFWADSSGCSGRVRVQLIRRAPLASSGLGSIALAATVGTEVKSLFSGAQTFPISSAFRRPRFLAHGRSRFLAHGRPRFVGVQGLRIHRRVGVAVSLETGPAGQWEIARSRGEPGSHANGIRTGSAAPPLALPVGGT